MSNEFIHRQEFSDLRDDIKSGFKQVTEEVKASRERLHDLNDKIQLQALTQAIQQQQIEALEEHPGLGGIKESMDKGFAGVHARLDRVNGRLDTHTSQIASAAMKAEMQEKAIDGLKNQLTAQLASGDTLPGKTKAILAGGASIGGLAVLHSLFEMVKSIGPSILKLFGG